MSRVVIDISAHGFGHAGQVAPVIAALRAARPRIDLIVRSGLGRGDLETFLDPPFSLHPPAPDFGLLMKSPVEVDLEATRAAYARLHAQWRETLDREAAALRDLDPALVLSNAGYVGLAAAQRCGIANIALGSLNWADVLEAFKGVDEDVLDRIRSCYQQAEAFIQFEPHLPMAWMENRWPVAPIARRGRNRRQDLVTALGCRADTVLALVTLGGIRNGADVLRLPQIPGVLWLRDGPDAPHMVSISALPFRFIDALASSDAVVTKTGYGTLVEAACNGVPVLYLSRPDWPESPFLEGWIQAEGRGRPVPEDPESIGPALLRLIEEYPGQTVAADGIGQACDLILRVLDRVEGTR